LRLERISNVAPRLNVIVTSTRPGRVGPAIGRWFEKYAREHGAFEPVLVDLAAFELPIYDEPHHPRLQKYEHAHTKAWSESVRSADAFAFVVPEYNYGPPPSLVNALNYVYVEWNYKAAGFVSYGGVSGGLRSVQAVKAITGAVKLVTPPEGVAIPNVAGQLDDRKEFVANDLNALGAKTMLDELARWDGALRSLRG
jgi:NAD(P)H-dependent FMN reductase